MSEPVKPDLPFSADELSFLLEATPEEWDAFIGCPHTGDSYVEPGPLTGAVYTRCADCHTVLPAPGEGEQ